jgi:hypothetical protein
MELVRTHPEAIIPVFLISNSTLHWKRQTAHDVCFLIPKSGKQEESAVPWNRGVVVSWCRL